MGMLVDGRWRDVWYDTAATGGRFVRKESQFRHWIGDDTGRFPAEVGRYHLYAGFACPWAHRALIMRALKGLDKFVSVSMVHWLMADQGWTFEPGEGVIPDTVNHARYLHEIYSTADQVYTGRVTIPVLWDRRTRQIVNNESADIVRIFGTAFDRLGAASGDYYPENLRPDIDLVNNRVYETLNNGVYRAGFATTQQAYEEAVYPLFESLDWLEARLDGHDWLVGDRLTEADIRLFTTLIRFDAIYHGHFKCNLRRIRDYPHLAAFTQRLASDAKIKPTIDLAHAKRHYYQSHRSINPTGIVPAGPLETW
ncbi:glutathione S-transferase family protein [Sphingomonas oryzagri]